LARQHGFCHRHATKEHKEASARCKSEFESLRQNAGRKTLGQIAREFDMYLEDFRKDRRLEDAEIQQQQKKLVLGSGSAQASAKESVQEGSIWDWRYTPRPCTKASCQTHYSPFSNHLFSFYTTPQSFGFLPLHTLCPSCSKAEIEAVEGSVQEKWTSRCGWEENEWNQWFENATKDRAMELDFWEKAQERVVKEKGPAMWVKRATAQEEKLGRQTKECSKQGKRKSLLKRWFTTNAS
jgi:hypothetical protein